MPTIAIIAQGAMGAGIGQRLSANGVTVLTDLSGRSQASAARAAAAGMRAASPAECARADMLLSVLPPAEALPLAERYAPLLRPGTLYADCNAISPAMAQQIAAVLAPSGCGFVDAGIIGGPPRPDGYTPKLYSCGPQAARLEALEAHGLKVPLLAGPIGAASALKMSFAAITKGCTALGAASFLAAERAGAAAALHAELHESQPAMAAWLGRFIPNMYAKAYRFVGEMEEISAFLGEDEPRAEAAVFAGIAAFYARLAEDQAGEKEEVGALQRFLAQGKPG